MYIIDLHREILSGVGDSVENIIDIIGEAYGEGVRVIFTEVRSEEQRLLLSEVKDIISRLYPDFFICTGGKVCYSEGIGQQLFDHSVATLAASDYILVDFPEDISFSRLQETMRQAVTAGYQPVLAGTEKYACLAGQLELIKDLVAQGVFIQVDTQSLVGHGAAGNQEDAAETMTAGDTEDTVTYAWCRQMIENKLVHFVATGSSPESTMGDACNALKSCMEYPELKKILYSNAVCIMRNKAIA